MLAAIERIVNAEAEASRALKKPEITSLDRYAFVKNDPAATERALGAFRTYFPADRVQDTHPSVFWFVGGTDPQTYARAKESDTTTHALHPSFIQPWRPVWRHR